MCKHYRDRLLLLQLSRTRPRAAGVIFPRRPTLKPPRNGERSFSSAAARRPVSPYSRALARIFCAQEIRRRGTGVTVCCIVHSAVCPSLSLCLGCCQSKPWRLVSDEPSLTDLHSEISYRPAAYLLLHSNRRVQVCGWLVGVVPIAVISSSTRTHRGRSTLPTTISRACRTDRPRTAPA